MTLVSRYQASLLVALLAVAGAASASPVAVNPTGTADGNFVGISVTGDANAGVGCYDLPEPIFLPCFGLLAVSGTGDANGLVAVSGTGDANGFVAVCPLRPLECQTFPFVSAPIVSSAELGPDADGDGFPAYVRVHFANAGLDVASGDITLTPAGASDFRVDTNDANPNAPVPDPTSIRPAPVVLVVPVGVGLGPDADGDKVPASVLLATAVVRVDPESGDVTVTPGAGSVVGVDPNDADPNRPIPQNLPNPTPPSTVSVVVPTGLALGPDEDGDNVPAFVEAQESRVTLDLANGALTLEPTRVTQRELDPNDAEREVHVNPTGDADGSVLAVSGTGDAESCGPRLTCFAVSGTGDASGYWAASGTGDVTSCLDFDFLCTGVSGTGDCHADDICVSLFGSASANDFAFSGAGEAESVLPLSVFGNCNGNPCATVDVDGAHAHYAGVSPLGPASGLVAVSGAGDAEGGLVAVSLLGHANGPVGVSGCDVAGC